MGDWKHLVLPHTNPNLPHQKKKNPPVDCHEATIQLVVSFDFKNFSATVYEIATTPRRR